MSGWIDPSPIQGSPKEREKDPSVSASAHPPESDEGMTFLQKVARLYNPQYQWKRIREDFHSATTALRHWHFDHSHEFSVLANSFRGKMFAAFFISGLMVWPGVLLSWWVQAKTENTFLGIATMLLFTQISCTIGYQLLWYVSNRELYRKKYESPKERFLGLERDMLPVQWQGFKMVMPVVSVTYPVVATLTHWIATMVPGAIKFLPAGALSFLIEFLLISTPFMRAMGDLFDRHGKKLAAKYVEATNLPSAA
jgi:hypothetical protein